MPPNRPEHEPAAKTLSGHVFDNWHFGLVKFCCILLAFTLAAFGQNGRWDIGAPGSAGAVTISGSGLPFLVAQPGVVLAWCQYPANATPCTNYANSYPSQSSVSACPTNAQVVLQGSNTCQATGDNFGNLGVWATPGVYSYTLTVNGVNAGPYIATIGVSGPGSPSGSLQANNGGFFAGVPNSSVNFTTGDISSTANLSFGNLNATAASSAADFVSNATNPAQSGAVRLANSDLFNWRNHANNADEGIGVDSSDRGNFSFAGGAGLTGATAKLWFGGFTSSFPMLKPVSTGLMLRLGDDSGDAGPFEALSYVVNGSQSLTGVQGSTGTKFFSCTGSFSTNHLVKVDANGNCVDSGQASATGANAGSLLIQQTSLTGCSSTCTFTYPTAYVSGAPACVCSGVAGSCNVASISTTACTINTTVSTNEVIVSGAP